MGGILLEGGAEFQGRMAEPDLEAIALAEKTDLAVCIIPAAAAADNNHLRAGNTGVRWFQTLGVKNVRCLPVIDKTSANDRHLAENLTHADLIFLIGGFPMYLAETLRSSLCWSAILEAYQKGATIAGSSAGAMVLCEWFINPENRKIHPGLGFISNILVIPHYETTGKSWSEIIHAEMPGALVVGIDEQTGMIQKRENTLWGVHGEGTVTVHHNNNIHKYAAGDRSFDLSELKSK